MTGGTHCLSHNLQVFAVRGANSRFFYARCKTYRPRLSCTPSTPRSGLKPEFLGKSYYCDGSICKYFCNICSNWPTLQRGEGRGNSSSAENAASPVEFFD